MLSLFTALQKIPCSVHQRLRHTWQADVCTNSYINKYCQQEYYFWFILVLQSHHNNNKENNKYAQIIETSWQKSIETIFKTLSDMINIDDVVDK